MLVSRELSHISSLFVDFFLLLLGKFFGGVVLALFPFEFFMLRIPSWGGVEVGFSISSVLEYSIDAPSIVSPVLVSDVGLWSSVKSRLVKSATWSLSWGSWWTENDEWVSVISLKRTLRKMVLSIVSTMHIIMVLMVLSVVSTLSRETLGLNKFIDGR
jgi:hypothetical protein